MGFKGLSLDYGEVAMVTDHEGLKSEMAHVTKPFEVNHIRSLFDGTDPLMHEIAYSLITGNQNEVGRLTKEALDGGFEANTVLDDGLISGRAIGGIKFRDHSSFVPDVLVAARAMQAGMAHIEPILSASGVEPAGIIVMGTVKGDLHDIGKNLCIMMLRGSGFVVHDLGVDTKPDEFIEAAVEHGAQVVGMSALLTTTMPNMGRTIQAFDDAGLRESIKMMVGGAPVTQEFAEDMGADGYGKDAIDCVDLAKRLTSEAEAVEAVSA